MRVPTDKEIEEAKEYLRQRLDAELSMRTNLQIVMIEAVKQIIDISYRYKISPELFRFSANRQLQEEVDAIILSLLEIIEDYTYTLAVATHEDNKDAIGSSSNLVVISFLFQLSSSFLILLKVVDMFAF